MRLWTKQHCLLKGVASSRTHAVSLLFICSVAELADPCLRGSSLIPTQLAVITQTVTFACIVYFLLRQSLLLTALMCRIVDNEVDFVRIFVDFVVA